MNTEPTTRSTLRRDLTDGGIATTTRNEEDVCATRPAPAEPTLSQPDKTRPDDKGDRHHHEFREPAGNMMGTAPGVSVTEGPKGTDPNLPDGHTTTPQRSQEKCGGVNDRRGGWLPVYDGHTRASK